ncbi:MAG: hypothetical protein QOG57_1500 [Pseudonocardiales bacterium]|nr:hypothetical protein [Pseudonocardiales bacterium]
MTCTHCGTPMSDGARRDRLYCTKLCRQRAANRRRRTGTSPPPRWQHPALQSDDQVLRAAASRAEELGQAHGWSRRTIRGVLDVLTAVLADRRAGQRVSLTEVRTRTARGTSSVRVAEVLADLQLLHDDTTPAIRSWIERRTGELPAGFVGDVRAWLLMLLDGDARSRPRSHALLYSYLGSIRPLLRNWAPTRAHLREITITDIDEALSPLRGWPRRNTISSLRSLFSFTKKRGLVFTNPTKHLKGHHIERSLLPMTSTEIRDVEHAAATPMQQLVVALAAVHAARATTIRNLTLDDLDLPNRRVTIAGHRQRLGELTHQALLAWLERRRASWPHTPNRHVLITPRTALGVGPVSTSYLSTHLLRRGVHLEQIRGDRVLHEALSSGADPLHLALVFNLSHTAASRYAIIAQNLLDDRLEQAPEQ